VGIASGVYGRKCPSGVRGGAPSPKSPKSSKLSINKRIILTRHGINNQICCSSSELDMGNLIMTRRLGLGPGQKSPLVCAKTFKIRLGQDWVGTYPPVPTRRCATGQQHLRHAVYEQDRVQATDPRTCRSLHSQCVLKLFVVTL